KGRGDRFSLSLWERAGVRVERSPKINRYHGGRLSRLSFCVESVVVGVQKSLTLTLSQRERGPLLPLPEEEGIFSPWERAGVMEDDFGLAICDFGFWIMDFGLAEDLNESA
ncbi:MAG: hypothetical protein RDV41_11150, partial [Planctomycetota bacterium]|nr:hypothetical protein [Planctomycetota bacterium]